MAAPNQWNINGLNLNDPTGILTIMPGHIMLNHLSLLVAPPPAPGGGHTIEMQKLHLMALALSKRDPLQVVNLLDDLVVGDHKLDLAATIRILGVAFTAGFSINIPAGPLHLNYNLALQTALLWASRNTISLDILRVNDWVALPVIPAANHNHYRFQLTVGMLVSGGMFVPLVDFLSMIGYIHTVASRGNNSRFGEVVVQQENFVAGALNIAPTMRAPMIAQTISSFTLPLGWRSFPHPTQYPDSGVVACLKQRFFADDPSRANRRMSFMISLDGILSLGRYPTLARFLQPASSETESMMAYDVLVQQLFTSLPEAAYYSEHTVVRLDTEVLIRLGDVADAADQAVPLHLALQRANTAVQVFHQRAAAIQNAPLNASSNMVGTSVNRAQKADIHNLLSVLPWFGPFVNRVIQLQAANPTNELPIINAALGTQNVAVFQIVTGGIKGVADLHPAWRILETVANRFINFVSYNVCMSANGSRPPHTLSFHFEASHLSTFLSGERDKFLKLPILDICVGIKKARDQLSTYSVDVSRGFFDSPEVFEVLRMFQHFLSIWRFKASGPGSWEEALNRISEFRTTGINLPAEGRKNHLVNVKKLYDTLLADFFDNLLPFTGPLDGALITSQISDRVYEAGGDFDQQMQFQTQQTALLNGLLNLNPAFSLALSGGSSRTPRDPDDKGGGGKFQKSGKSRESNGSIIFGKGTGGPTYSIGKCMENVKTIVPGANRGNFCLASFLANDGACSNSKHSKTSPAHKFSPELVAVRDSFESKPYRTDAKAK
jgi:hypothetical protein